MAVEHTIDERSPLAGHTQQSLAVSVSSEEKEILISFLPVAVEHTIDERSLLAGHTQQSLAVSAASEDKNKFPLTPWQATHNNHWR